MIWDQRKVDIATVRYLLRQARIARETHWRPEHIARYLNQAGEVRRAISKKGS